MRKAKVKSKVGKKSKPEHCPTPDCPGAGCPPSHSELHLPASGCKVLGSVEQPVRKSLEIQDVKVSVTDGVVTLKGYANTKGVADRYGDIPTVMPQLRNYVYELGQFRKNPVMLIDHKNSVEYIAGSYSVLREDERGLYFEASFSQSNASAPVAHARTVYAEGHGKALSIAGKWFYEDKDNPANLTYADIFEISLVGVGADPNALGSVPQEEPAKGAPIEEVPDTNLDAEKNQQKEDAQKIVTAIEGIMKKLDDCDTARKVMAEMKRLEQILAQAI